MNGELSGGLLALSAAKEVSSLLNTVISNSQRNRILRKADLDMLSLKISIAYKTTQIQAIDFLLNSAHQGLRNAVDRVRELNFSGEDYNMAMDLMRSAHKKYKAIIDDL